MAWLNPTEVSTGTPIEIRIGTRTSGPPVPVTDDRNPVTAPTASKTLFDTLAPLALAVCCVLRELIPDKTFRRPRQASSRRGSKTLTAHAPANAAGVPPIQSRIAIPQ